MVKKDCIHENTRKLFYMDNSKGKWMRTNYAFCLECKSIISKEKVEVKKNE